MKLARIGWLAGVITVCLGLGWPMESRAAKSTTAVGNGNWADGIWDAGAPDEGDDVTINSGVTVTLSSTPGYGLSVLTVNGTLVFTNWDTSLSATTVTIGATGSATLPPAFTDSQMSNRVYFVCADFTLASGGSINVNGKGWAGGNPLLINKNGYGLGFGTSDTSEGDGAGYGGKGGGDESAAGAGAAYGDKTQPIDPGSGGGAASNANGIVAGGSGGGTVRIQADGGTVTINGTISANGGAGVNISSGGSGAGSGGGIYISCNTFAANNGMIRANGGAAGGWGGAGGAGRVAIVCSSATQSGL